SVDAPQARRLVPLRDLVRPVLAQPVLRAQRPFRIEARAMAQLDRFAKRVHRLVLERQRLALQRRSVELALLFVESARNRRLEQPLVEVAVRLSETRERRLAPARAPDRERVPVRLEER